MVSFKYKDKKRDELLCDEECQGTVRILKNEILFHIKFYLEKFSYSNFQLTIYYNTINR